MQASGDEREDDTGADGADGARSHRREVLHELTGVLAAAALRLEVVRRRQGPEVPDDADLASVEAAVAEARRIVADLQHFEARGERDGG